MSEELTPRCAHCGELIEAYEATTVVQFGESKDADAELTRLAKWHYHRVCHDALKAAHEHLD